MMTKKAERGSGLVPLALFGGGVLLWVWSTRKVKAAPPTETEPPAEKGAPSQPEPPTTESPAFEGITLAFEPPDNPNVKPMTPISQFMVLQNGTSEPRELAVIVEAQNAEARLWRKVAGTIPIDVEPGQEERFVIPAFAFEPHVSHRGSWHFRGTVWDEAGKVIVVREHRNLYLVIS